MGTTHTYSWDWYNHFIARFFGVLEWWLALALGLFLFILPSIVARCWYNAKKPPPPKPPKTMQVRMVSLPEVQPEPRRSTRISMMSVPAEPVIEQERVEQELRKSTAVDNAAMAISLGEISLTAPRLSESSARSDKPTPAPSPGRGFAFSSSDQTSQAMWELSTQKSITRQKSLGRVSSAASAASSVATPSRDGKSEWGAAVMPSASSIKED